MSETLSLHPIAGNPSVMLRGIEDVDAPMRRIFPLWLLQRAVRLQQLTLVRPGNWEDPHEDPASLCMLNGQAFGRGQQPLTDYLAPAWGQCWSFNPGSDTLMRAYSRVILDPLESRNVDPRNEGVSVVTTPRRMKEAMKAWQAHIGKGHFVLGCVAYLAPEEISQQLARILNSDLGPKFFRMVQGRAHSLLWKRNFFHHEQEVRLLHIQPDDDPNSSSLLHLPFDPNQLFQDISFDPRLRDFERDEREAEMRRVGYTGAISYDESYLKTLTGIHMTKDWGA